jgi:DNA-binding transcriptional ArsR family regulator
MPRARADRGKQAAAATDDGPDRERLISDVETLKALSDPLRLKILEAMVARSDEPWSVKELAAALGVPQTRLYHHVDLLLERDLVRVTGQRVVSGIIETRYRVAALAFRLDHKLLAADVDGTSGASTVVATVLNAAREDLEAVLRETGAGPADPEAPNRPLLTRGLAHLTDARAGEFRSRLQDLVAEFDADPPGPATKAYGLLLALYASPSASKEPSHG